MLSAPKQGDRRTMLPLPTSRASWERPLLARLRRPELIRATPAWDIPSRTDYLH
jgi:hypothetical protein